MDKQRHSMFVSYSVVREFEKNDLRFKKILIDVLHDGQNFNGSVFQKPIIEKNVESIKNTPVLGYILFNEDGTVDDFDSHCFKSVPTKSGGNKIVYAGSAYGVIPESCNPRWVQKQCDDGVTRDFLQVEALLWTKFDESIEIFERDNTKPHSMEIFVDYEGYSNEEGVFVMTHFNFDGCCILSSTNPRVQPAMINSEAKLAYSQVIDEISMQIRENLATYQQTLDETYNIQKESEENMENGKQATTTDFALSLFETIDTVQALLKEIKYRDRWGDDCCKYWLMDIQDGIAIVQDYEASMVFGIPLLPDGDNFKLDLDNTKRMRAQWVEFVEGDAGEGEQVAGLEVTVVFTEKETYEKLQETAHEYAKVTEDLEQANAKLGQYAQAEEEREAKAQEEARGAVFASFDSSLTGDEAYAKLKEDQKEYSIEQLEEKCYAILGKKTQMNFAQTLQEPQEPPVAPVAQLPLDNVADMTPRAYGGLLDKYSRIN